MIPKIFYRYLQHLESEGKIIFMSRNKRRPSIKVVGSDYSWAWNNINQEYQWTGPRYWRGFPDELKLIIPDWSRVLKFSIGYEISRDLGDWPDDIKEKYSFTEEQVLFLTEVYDLCNSGSWERAIEALKENDKEVKRQREDSN